MVVHRLFSTITRVVIIAVKKNRHCWNLVRLSEYLGNVSHKHQDHVLCLVRALEFLGEIMKKHFFACLSGALSKLNTFS